MEEKAKSAREHDQSGTFYAPAARASADVLCDEFASASASPVLAALLSGVGGLVAILNRHRQVLSVNHAYLAFLGVDDPGRLLGLRPGETLGCVHVVGAPNGCGTGLACRSCGAAIALVTSQETGSPVEAECALQVVTGLETRSLSMRVRAFPLEVNGRALTLVFLDDITGAKRSAALESAFFHDINNIIQGLYGAVELMVDEPASIDSDILASMQASCKRLADEVGLQRALTTGGKLPVASAVVSAAELLSQACSAVARHPKSHGKELCHGPRGPSTQLKTDPVLALRVLTNMLINAIEETPVGGVIRASWRDDEEGIDFTVWNASHIPPEVAPRIFQRYFSTKGGIARGQGTYVMRLLGEDYLCGKVSFRSDPTHGTTFKLRLPFRAA